MFKSKKILFFDFDTTGLNHTDKIVRVVARLIQDGECIKEIDTFVDPEDERLKDSEGFKYHTTKWESLINAPNIEYVITEGGLLQMFNDADYICNYACDYDYRILIANMVTFDESIINKLSFLKTPLIDLQKLWQHFEEPHESKPKNLNNFIKKVFNKDMPNIWPIDKKVQFYEKSLEKAIKYFERYINDIDLDDVLKYTNKRKISFSGFLELQGIDNVIKIGFGKYKDQDVIDVIKKDSQYIVYMLHNTLTNDVLASTILNQMLKKYN